MPQELVDAYCYRWEKLGKLGGWGSPVPYMHVEELRALCLYRPLMELLKKLIGEEMGMHLNLTGWVSTERNWHQDDYLSPHYINSWYAAVWFALDKIQRNSGPFQFVPGSHRWPVLRGDRVRLYLKPNERTNQLWPRFSERLTNDIIENKIREENHKVEHFLGEKGDILIWHARLFHRGSVPEKPGIIRKAIITHYSGISHRLDMPKVAYYKNGSSYFFLDHPLDE